MLITEGWAYAIDPAIRRYVDIGAGRRPSLISRLFNVQTSTLSAEEVFTVGAVGIDAWEEFEKTRQVPSVEFDQGYKQTFTHKEYLVEMPIQRKLYEDAQLRQIFDMAVRLGDSAMLKREVDAAGIFNNAFASGTGGDSVYLCSDSHPQSPAKSSATQDNSYALSLSKANVRTVREAMMAFTDDTGSKLAVTPNALLVPPALEDDARVIVNSALDPDSGNNAVNPQAGRFEVITWHYLTDSNAWFMLDTALMKQSLFWFDRVPLEIKQEVQTHSATAVWSAYMRYSFGWGDWRWIAGSNPS